MSSQSIYFTLSPKFRMEKKVKSQKLTMLSWLSLYSLQAPPLFALLQAAVGFNAKWRWDSSIPSLNHCITGKPPSDSQFSQKDHITDNAHCSCKWNPCCQQKKPGTTFRDGILSHTNHKQGYNCEWMVGI